MNRTFNTLIRPVAFAAAAALATAAIAPAIAAHDPDTTPAPKASPARVETASVKTGKSSATRYCFSVQHADNVAPTVLCRTIAQWRLNGYHPTIR